MGTERLEQPHDIWVAIPVFNNKDTVRAVALACRDELPNVLVVDDGSTDTDVAALFKGTDIVVLKHDRNQGKGRAILTALRHVREHGARYMITIDADGQHDPRDIRKFLPVLADQSQVLVIGTRCIDAPNRPGSSRFGMRFSDFWLRLETGVAMKDTQSGFRAYPVAYVSQLSLSGNAYDFEVDVLAKAAWAGLTIKSVDIGVTYAPKDERISHFRPFLDNLRIAHRHVALVGRRLLPWPHRRLVPRDQEALKVRLRHPIRMLRTLLLEHATPVELGMAAALGTFLATLPLISLHTVVIVYAATRLRLNVVMAVAIQNLCMPPFVPFLCVELGHFMRYGRWLNDLTAETWIHQAAQRVWEWFLGSLVAAPVIAVITGILVFGVAASVRKWSPKPGKIDA